jgi:hypothetical protein
MTVVIEVLALFLGLQIAGAAFGMWLFRSRPTREPVPARVPRARYVPARALVVAR